MSVAGDGFILEQEEDEQESYCSECDHVHSCSTACYYEDDGEDASHD